MHIRFKIFTILLFFIVLPVIWLKAGNYPVNGDSLFFALREDCWVNQQMRRMTMDEKIAQLMMVAVYPLQSEAINKCMVDEIKTWKPGGIIVMQGSPVKTARWINEFQDNMSVPLLVAIDGEWGLSMRIDSTIVYPYAQAIGAINNSTFIYQMGRDIAWQMKQMGIHLNFAPVADVNTNPQNPVINFRSFGEDQINLSGTPSSLSKKIIDGYLREEIGYNGFVITDAINMKGVQTKEGNTEVEALKAGYDMVLFVPGLQNSIASVKQALADGEITLGEIETKCRRVLAVKRWAGLDHYLPVSVINLTARLNSPCFEVTNRKLIQNSLTVLTNGNVLPVQDFNNLKIASVMIGSGDISPFQKMLDKYTGVDHFFLEKEASERQMASLRAKLDNYNLVIAGIQGINLYPSGKYGTSEIQRNALADFIRDNNVIAVFFGNAYALKYFENIHRAKGLILAYQNTPLIQELAAQLVFGAFDASGKLPVTIDARFTLADGLHVRKNNTLAYTIPEEAGINSAMLTAKIDSLANLGIEKEAYPGCQVLIAKDGNVIFHKCYGFHTYEKDQTVTPDNIYDWASLTKVTGPLPALMKLVEEKKMDLDVPFSNYWPDFLGTEKGRLPVRDYLTHQAMLPAWIPFWRMGLDQEGKLSREVFQNQPSDDFSVRVSNQLYLNNCFKQIILDTIKNAKSLPLKKYVYSDLGFYLYPDIIAGLAGTSYEEYIQSNFYRPLGAVSVTYNPYLHFPPERIIPTETDDFFRNERLRGFVHDEGAAMLGGVSGNAGLFGTANDLAKIFQMYLQKGYFGGKRFISEKTVNEFTRVQFPENKNRRALGFDKPLIDNHKNKINDAYPAVSASKNSFGHTGFTGTIAWADPDKGILFIFMSNRVHPTRENLKLSNLNIRTLMHQAIYDCMEFADK